MHCIDMGLAYLKRARPPSKLAGLIKIFCKHGTKQLLRPLTRIFFFAIYLPYNLRDSNNLALLKARPNLYGIDAIRFVGLKLWQTLTREIKESHDLRLLKEI